LVPTLTGRIQTRIFLLAIVGSLVILSLYVASQDVLLLYRHPAILWTLVPVMLYWIARIWLLALRRDLHEDPIVFALRDPASYVSGILCVAAMLVAT
jgi:4-hydroxybenzoate polyprenyltransferase